MGDCIFCKIVRGEIPSAKVYEDDVVVAFLDIAPINTGHTLIAPKQHYERLEDVPDEVLAAMVKTAKLVAKALQKAYGYRGYNVVVNVGKVAGQEIPHVHLHVIPRRENDGCKIMDCPRSKPPFEELTKVSEVLRKTIEELRK